MHEPLSGPNSFRDQIVSMVANALGTLEESAAAALKSELQPDLVAQWAASLLKEASRESVTLSFRQLGYGNLCSGIELLREWSNLLSPNAALLIELRNGSPTQAEAEIYRTIVAQIASAFPRIPPDTTLDVLVPQETSLAALHQALISATPAKGSAQSLNPLCEVSLSHPQLQLLSGATKLLESLRADDTESLAIALYSERLFFSAIQLVAQVVQDEQTLRDFRRYVDPPIPYQPGPNPLENLAALAKLGLSRDAWVCGSLELPPHHAEAIVRAVGAMAEYRVTFPLMLGQAKVYCSVDGKGKDVILTAHHTNRQQQVLDEAYAMLKRAGLRQCVEEAGTEQTARNIKGARLHAGTLKTPIDLTQVIDIFKSLPLSNGIISLFCSKIRPGILKEMEVRADQIERFALAPHDTGDFLQEKLNTLHFQARSAYAQILGVQTWSTELHQADLIVWREAYRDFVNRSSAGNQL